MASLDRPDAKAGWERTQAVIDAIRHYNLTKSPSWKDLDALSTRTHVDGLEVDPAGIIFESEDRFRGVLNVYVVLEYASETNDEFQTSDSFLGKFKGHFNKKGYPVIDEIKVDTSPFFEGELKSK
jgi:hypothetical protein